MKNFTITAVTVFALAASTASAGEHSMDMNNAFSYSKSTQSAGSVGSVGSAGSSPASYEGANAVMLVGLVALVLVCLAVCGGGSHNYPTKSR